LPAVYSVRVFAAHDAQFAAPATYTVPLGKRLILRDLDFYSGVLTGNFCLVLFAGSPDIVFFQASWAAREIGWRPWRGRQVFYAGDEIYTYGNQPVDVIGSGYLLND
jgi:hypothetical protein